MENNHPKADHYAIKGVATASMVLGICALAFNLFLPTLGAIMGAVALVTGVISKKKLLEAGQPAGKATAGIVTGIIALAFGIAFTVACAVLPKKIGEAGATAANSFLNNLGLDKYIENLIDSIVNSIKKAVENLFA